MTKEVKKMSKVYVVMPILLKNEPRDGRFTNIPYLPGLDIKIVRTLTEAREYAYSKLPRHGFNYDKQLFCVIASRGENNEYKLAGLVKINPWNVRKLVRYWFPSKDGVCANGGQYRLLKDGSLGRKVR